MLLAREGSMNDRTKAHFSSLGYTVGVVTPALVVLDGPDHGRASGDGVHQGIPSGGALAAVAFGRSAAGRCGLPEHFVK